MKNVLILMTSYNGEKYIEEQIDSLLKQKNVNVSILIRDDGSTDGTQAILKCYAGKKILKWYTGEHLNVDKGIYDLMTKALTENSEYIAFCDHDDVWDPDKLSIAVNQLGKYDCQKPSLYYCGQRLVDKNLHLIEEHKLNTKRTLCTRFVLSDIAGCTAVFNRALLMKILQYQPQYMLMHDTWIFKVCLCVGGNVFVDPDSHINYRQHGENTIGLGHSFKAYIKQVKQYINEYKVEKQICELKKGYYSDMTDEYKKLTDYICGYRNNIEYRMKLLDKSYINFFNIGLNITYILKIMLNKL